MSEMFGEIVAVAGWFAGFVREMDRGLAVGHGNEPVGQSDPSVHHGSRGLRDASYGRPVAGKNVRIQQRSK